MFLAGAAKEEQLESHGSMLLPVAGEDVGLESRCMHSSSVMVAIGTRVFLTGGLVEADEVIFRRDGSTMLRFHSSLALRIRSLKSSSLLLQGFIVLVAWYSP
jgi:hypothetical protein